jgi:hypothetical protein
MAEWYEFRLWWDTNRKYDNVFTFINYVFTFKKKCILAVLDKYGIDDFLMLDEPGFVLLRVNVSKQCSNQILEYFEEQIKTEPLVSKVTLDVWSPTEDAKNRILEARKRAEKISQDPEVPMEIQGLEEIPLGGWMINGRTPDGKWKAEAEKLDKQIEAFSIFMTKVVGNFTKAYIKEMPYRVEDRWLMSVFIHLLLDSISIGHTEEYEMRGFPFI